MSRSFSDSVGSFDASSASVSVVSNYYTVADDWSEFLAWLSPLAPRIRHRDVRTRRVDNVGGWLLRTDEFRRWCDGARNEEPEYAALFCCGGPAVGKTYFTSLVVDRLCDKAREQNIAVACFYVDFAARDEQTPTNMLGSLLKQLVAGLERIPDEIRRIFQDYKKVIGERGLRVPEIVKMLQTITSLQPTFICIDALDECAEGHLPGVLDSLRQILEKSPNTRIFLTGRQHIWGEIEGHLVGRAAVLPIKPNNDDIIGYIRMRLSEDTSVGAIDSGLEAEIIKRITESIPETFLLISLTMDAILGEPTARSRRRKLKTITNGLDLKDVYGTTVDRIKKLGVEKARLGMAALMWISHSERPLRLDELVYALAVEIGSTDLDSRRIPSAKTLLSCCLGLVVIDKEASVVRLVHFTLQEYLCISPDLFGATHSIMAETCLTYLNFRTTKEISSTQFAPPRSTPFLQYSSLYWGVHARRKTSSGVVSLALKLFSQIETHISTKLLLLNIVSRAGRYTRDIPTNGHLTGFTGLHCASVFGIVEITNALLCRLNFNLNKRDFLGITPLIWAAVCGNEEVAKLLLERQLTILDKPDKLFHRTALSWAAGKGHEGIVRMLLGRADCWWGGALRVMNMVLGRRHVNPNMPDKYGQTALSFASEEGHERVVKLLLGRKDAEPDAADEYGRTPLLLASSKGREAVVKLLVEREDVNIDRPDESGETPLLLAAGYGHRGIVGLLLKRKDTESDMVDKHCQTLLFLGAKNGHDRVVQLLLGREGINPDMPDNTGRAPLSLAAENGHEGVVKLLLGRKAVNPDRPDNDGWIPLSWAAMKGRYGVVKLLLGREGANPEAPGGGGRTPLSLAAENGRGEVVKLLLGREDVNPNTPDNTGQTPLSWAAGNGRNEIVELLLGREDVSPDTPNRSGWTPLLFAASNGCSEVVRLLLGREDVNPDMPDNLGQTPLFWATAKRHTEVVKLLLEREDVNPDKPSKSGRTPLSLAAGNGHEEIVKLLLEREDVNPNVPNKDGLTPLSLASMVGHTRVVKLLQARKPVNLNSA